MKKILFSAVFGGLIIIAGCSKDKLNLYPYNTIATQQAFTSQQQVAFDVNGMYNGLKALYVGTSWNIIADVLADNLVLNQVGRQSLRTPFYNYTYNSANTLGLFTTAYGTIRRANAILENINSFPAGSFKNDAIGQALAVRAFSYFDMARVYSKTYLNASATDFTAPYVTTTDATNVPASEPLKGFYDKIIADLVQAEPMINTAATNNNGNITFNREAVAGLLSRVYLYKGDYANCILEANKALGATPNVGTIATFPSIWTDATSTGVLFKVKNTTLDNINVPGTNYYQAVTGGIKSEYVCDFGFYQLFANNDIRKSTYMSTSAYNGVLYNHIIKYAGRPGSPAGVVDVKTLRTAEVLLNRMEAEYRSGAIAAAIADLVILKSNRYIGYVATADNALTGTALLNEILLQRRLELAFEGDRFYDLKRLNLPVQRSNNGEHADGTGTPPQILTLAAGDYRFNLPFPQAEITFNPKILQNPGY